MITSLLAAVCLSRQEPVRPLSEYKAKGYGIVQVKLSGSASGSFKGVRVTVKKGGPAWTAGLVSGDIIYIIDSFTMLNNSPTYVSQFKEYIKSATEDDKQISVLIVRSLTQTTEILLKTVFKPMNGIDDFQEVEGASGEAKNPNSIAVSSLTCGGIGIREAEDAYDESAHKVLGVRIKVQKGSSLDLAGVRDGDTLESIDNLRLDKKDVGDQTVILRAHLLNYLPDASHKIVVIRGEGHYGASVKQQRGIVDQGQSRL